MVSIRMVLLLLGAVLLALVAASTAGPQGPSSAGMMVVGAILCTKSGKQPPGIIPAGSDIKVTMICNGSVAGNAFTGFNGAFVMFNVFMKIAVPGPIGCFVEFLLPNLRCPNLTPTRMRRVNVTVMGPIIPNTPAVGCLMGR